MSSEENPPQSSEKQSWFDPKKHLLWIATCYGFYLLLMYTFHYSIPFPLELSVLPALLVVVAFIAFISYLFVIIYTTMGSLFFTDAITGREARRLKIGQMRNYKSNWARVTINLFFVVLFPVATAWYSVIIEGSHRGGGLILFLVALLVLPLLFAILVYQRGPFKLLRKHQSKKYSPDALRRRFWEAVAVYFGSFGLMAVSALVYLAILLKARLINEEFSLNTLYAALLFLGLNSTSIILFSFGKPLRGRGFCCGVRRGSKALRTRRYGSAFMVVGVFMVISLFPQIAAKLGAFPLRLLNIGGGVQKTYIVKTGEARNLPQNILYGCDENNCFTRPLNVYLDAGDDLFAMVDGAGDGQQMFQLPRRKMYEHPAILLQGDMLQEQEEGFDL